MLKALVTDSKSTSKAATLDYSLGKRYTDAKVSGVYFLLAVMGFSFWFLLAVPFASHRESYWWLAMVHNESFATSVHIGISSTFRPFAQATTWAGFWLLNRNVFPTSALRQILLQSTVYALFVSAWWLIYRSVNQRRLFATLAFVAGGVFFSGYVHLFHIYGLFYAAVILTLGSILYLNSKGNFIQSEVLVAAIAITLVFWHPFATALFLGFYFGYYLDTIKQRTARQKIQWWAIAGTAFAAIFTLVVLFPRNKGVTLHERLFGFLVSYQASEVNKLASAVALLFTMLTIMSMKTSRSIKITSSIAAGILGLLFIVKGIPVLLIWVPVVLIKLFEMRRWGIFFLALTAVALPLGGGLGGPMYVLFAIIMGLFAMVQGWNSVEERLARIDARAVGVVIIVSLLISVSLREGIRIPVVSGAAKPIMRERERSYQLENMLSWLSHSEYCSYRLGYLENAGNPVESVQSALSREHRPPSDIADVRLFWKNVLQCKPTTQDALNGTAVLAFDEPPQPGMRDVYTVEGKYAGLAKVWITIGKKP